MFAFYPFGMKTKQNTHVHDLKMTIPKKKCIILVYMPLMDENGARLETQDQSDHSKITCTYLIFVCYATMNYIQNRHCKDESLQNLFDIKALLRLIQKLNEWR